MISKSSIHAIRALACLAALPEGAHVGAGAIARQIGARQNYLGKLLQLLTHQGLVVSQKGLGGGFRLGRTPDTITLYDVAEPIDHVSRWNACFMGQASCANSEPCAVHERWGVVRDAYLSLLRETTIADLARRPALLSELPGPS